MNTAWKLVLGALLGAAFLAGASSRPVHAAGVAVSPVQVTASGVTQIRDGMGVGFALKNTSKGDATDVEVSYFAVTGSGAPVSAGSFTIHVIPAGETFYAGEEIDAIAAGRTATKIEAYVKVGETVLARYHLPLVSKVTLIRSGTEMRASGTVKNTLKAPLSSLAQIGIVLFDKSGKVLGGTHTYPRGDVPKGKTAAWETTFPFIKGAVSAKASAENEGLESKPIEG